MTVGDWDRRELCPDGSCTGLIGPEGTCKVCGRAAPNWGDERKRGTQDVDDDDDEVDDDEDDDEVAAPDAAIMPSAPARVGPWAERKLCSDGACVGVIGDDGKCKVCGKPAEASASEDDDEDADEDDDEYEDDYGDDDESDDEAEDRADGDHDELAAAAAELAGVAPSTEVAAAAKIAADAEEPERALCPDGACIGVIGDDGKCKICKKAAA